MFHREDQRQRPLSEFEQQLASLAPAGCSVNRDLLLYQAGRAAALAENAAALACAAQRSGRSWMHRIGSGIGALAAGLAGVWIGLWGAARDGGAPILPSAHQPAAHIAAVRENASGGSAKSERPAPQPTGPLWTFVPPADSQDAYLQVRNRVLARGVDAWSSSSVRAPARAAAPVSSLDLREVLRNSEWNEPRLPDANDSAGQPHHLPGASV